MSAPDPQGDVRAVLELGVKAATAYGRPDLVQRLNITLERVRKPDVQVVAIGEFKQGKSSLVNAIVNVNICPVDDDIATAVHTIVRHGEERRAFALVKSANDPDGEGQRIAIPLDQIRAYATELGGIDPSVIVKGVEIEVPRKLLADGLILVDTPGVGGLSGAHAAAGMGAISIADALLFISDASQEYTRAEMDFLAQALELCPSAVCVMTKTDLYPRWREVMEINKGHLARLGLNLPILAVSSMLRMEAIRREDKELNAQSGFPALIQYITNDLIAGKARTNRVTAQRDLFAVCDQLAGQFEAEKSALSDPAASAALVSGLERAKARAEALRGQASRWSTTLNDGVGDLTSDIDFDLRARMRAVMAEADSAIEAFDPLDSWDEFEPWLTNAVSQAVVANYRYLTERAATLSSEVARHFGQEGQELFADLEIHNAANVLSRVSIDPHIEVEDIGRGAKGLTALRGSYSGFLMVGLLGNLALAGVLGPALVPIQVGAGLILGRKTLKDEKERALMRRRSDAKNAVRRYSDEVQFQVGKDSRDTLRRVQRQLRDHYSARAEELNRSTSEALKSAQDAVRVAEADKSKRIKDVQAELDRIKNMRTQAERLTAQPASRQTA
ncbi:MAG: dynamin family protein [Acidimicrobiia bacterium]|nr:dynamin family protein [Acidimicrobiia bacterium]